MKDLKKYISTNSVITDNVPIIRCDDRIREEKASLMLLDLFLSGNQGQYMTNSSLSYFCDEVKMENGRSYNWFNINLEAKTSLWPLAVCPLVLILQR